MKLTDKEKAKINVNFSYLAPGIPRVKCPICGGETFGLQDDVYVLRSEDDLSRGIRMAVVHCQKCNYVELFALPPENK